MPRSSPILNSFNAGELSPRMAGRTDFAKYQNGCETLENFVLYPHGGATLRPGTYFVAEVKDSTKQVRLVDFEFSAEQAYVLEFGDQYIRFYMDQGQILDGASAYEIASPYLEADLDELKFAQSADVLYIVHRDYAPRKLTRTGHTAWTLTAITFDAAVTAEKDLYPAATLTPGATTGTGVTFTASASVFQSGDIDREIKSGAGRAIIKTVPTSPGTTCTADILDAFASTSAIAAGAWYLNGSPTGTLIVDKKEPIHGAVMITSMGGLNLRSSAYQWTSTGGGTAEYACYLAGGASAGLSEPDALYINGSLATPGTANSLAAGEWDFAGLPATVVVRLSDDTDPDTKSVGYIVTGTTGTPVRDAFRSADVGKYIYIHNGIIKITAYHTAQSVTGQILKVLDAITETQSWTLEEESWDATDGYPETVCFYEGRLFFARDDTVWGSVVQDYENFARSSDDDAAIEVTLLANEVNMIRWLEHGRSLIAGAMGGEWSIKSASTSDPITPTTIEATRETTHGSADLAPLVVGQNIVYAQRAGRKIRELTYKWEADGYLAPDLTILAEHITEGGIVDMAFQEEPHSVIWVVRADGVLLGLTYDRIHEVVGWHRHPMTGAVESITVIPGDNGEYELWLAKSYTINGATKRYIEYMKPFSWGEDQEDCFFVDCGLTYDGAATTEMIGLNHLEGETVGVLADGSTHPDRTVSSGQITLARSASVVQVGLKYTGKLKTMKIEAGSVTGTAQGKLKKISRCAVRFLNTLGGKIGSSEDKLETIYFRTSGDEMGGPPALFTGDKEVVFPKGFGTEGQVMIVQDQPLPMTVLAVMAEVQTSDER